MEPLHARLDSAGAALYSRPVNYGELVRTQWRLLAFGVWLSLLSGFGQTFFVALFNTPIRAEFGLSHAEFGSLYSGATLASGLTIPWLGRRVDRDDLRRFTLAVFLGLAAAALTLAHARHLAAIVIALYGIRLCGQGLLTHTAITTMARYLERNRGKALVVAGLGRPISEGALPSLGVWLLASYGWRGAWLWIALALGLLAAPLALSFLRGHSERHADWRESLAPRTDSGGARPGGTTRQWTAREVTRDASLLLLLPAYASPGFFLTGLFWHQGWLLEQRAWDPAWYAVSFVAFAATQLPASLVIGTWVDRIGAGRLVALPLVPLALGLFALALWDQAFAAPLFLGLSGLCIGAKGPVYGALWAERYGTEHLGAIRAMSTALLVGATALAPFLAGLWIDAGVQVPHLATACGIGVALAAGLAGISARTARRQGSSALL